MLAREDVVFKAKLSENFQRECNLYIFALLNKQMNVFEASDDKYRYQFLPKKAPFNSDSVTLMDQRPNSGSFAY